MSDNEINLAVARARGYKVTVNGRGVHFVWDDDGDFIGSIGGLPLAGNTKYDPRNDDAQAIAALERFDKTCEVEISRLANGTWVVDLPDAVRENRKLSHAVTDAILAAQEKRNAAIDDLPAYVPGGTEDA